MNKNYIIGGVGIIAVIVIGFVLMRSQKTSNEEQTAAPSVISQNQNVSPTVIKPTEATPGSKIVPNNTVEYTGRGFVPKSISVKAGTSVTWKNTGTKKMWVASSPHPAHTDLPGFDELSGAGSDGTYTYTFTKVGNWKYHNHLMPSDFGVVIVTK